ncbi:hypothetical protein [Streptomyces goshikiensis]
MASLEVGREGIASRGGIPFSRPDADDDQGRPRRTRSTTRAGALTPAQRAAAIHAQQQAAVPQEHLEGRTAAPATWMTSPQNLARTAALTRAAEARGRTIEEQSHPAMRPRMGGGFGAGNGPVQSEYR